MARFIRGESEIDLMDVPHPRIKRICLEPDMDANPTVLRAIEEADAIVLGPGDPYTGILPSLLVNGMPEAFASCDAVRIFVCNLMTKRGETKGFSASDFVDEMISYLPDASPDWAAINTSVPSSSIQTAYEEEQAYLVKPDLKSVRDKVGVCWPPHLQQANYR